MSIYGWIIWLAAFAGILLAGHYIHQHPEQFATASQTTASQTAATPIDPTTDAIRAFKIKQFSITKTGRGKNTVAVGTFTFENRGGRAVKDVQLRCDHAGENGTIIASSSPTISEPFEAHSVRTIRNLNLGVVRVQIAQSDCEVTGLSLVSSTKGP
jgi:hypothetical protein